MAEVRSPAEYAPPREILADGFELRALEDADPQAFFDLMQDADIQQFIPWASSVTTLDAAKERMQIPFSKRYIRYGIYQNERLSGFIGAWTEQDAATYFTGSALAKEFRGHGLSNKAFTEIIPVLQKAGGERVACYISEENEASKANITNRGLRPTDEFNDKGERLWEMNLR